MKADPNNSLRASYQYFSPMMTNWQMEDPERQRCVIDKLWIAILHFPITFAEFKIQNWLLTKTKLGGWTNATPIPITASSKNWFTIRQKFTLSWKRSLWQRCGRSSRIYSVYQNISPVELRIYSVLHELVVSTPATPSLAECPLRCSCRSSNTSENIKCQCQILTSISIMEFGRVWRKNRWLRTSAGHL